MAKSVGTGFMSGAQVRSSFLDFFKARDHVIKPSSSLVPDNDPTLMFTNSGMVQFKDNFAGKDKTLKRAASCQRSVRAGGKHNDLDNVGHTARHHTFFEMLGNFSFGDYFKEEAITWAWQWLTEELKIDPARLCVTVYHDDDEAFNLWHKKIGLKQDDIIRIATSDNFWTMGDTGPCGPSSEIFFDHGAHMAGGRPGTPEQDGDRFMEIWNLVFTQFDLQKDGSKVLLPNKNIDTGAGLERVMAVAQGVHSNWETDIFQTLIGAAGQGAGVKYGQDLTTDIALRVMADHLRTMSFLMVDGVMPSNEGRGYVLRRIMRRAMRYTHQLGIEKPYIYSLVPTLVNVMGEAYPELARGARMAMDTIQQEEERFGKTLKQGMKILTDESKGLNKGDTLDGAVAFKLYDTYGFPLDLTQDALRSREVSVDTDGFAKEMAGQKARARAAYKGSGDVAVGDVWFDVKDKHGATDYAGYTRLTGEGQVQALVKDGKVVTSATAGDTAQMVVNQTPFYAESGGQVGDTGVVTWDGGSANVTATNKVLGDVWVHTLTITTGTLKVETPVVLTVDAARHGRITRNHSATHLLHAVLREVLGSHVFQKGSRQDEHSTRFDISHPKAITAEELLTIERRVNELIWAAHPVETRIMTKDEAIALGAMALFGEKYGSDVRVVTMGHDDNLASIELCGGTHVKNTGEIGLFKLTGDSALSAGIRRIEGVTHVAAWQAFRTSENMLKDIAGTLAAKPEQVAERVAALQQDVKKLKQDAKKAGKATAGNDIASLAKQAEKVNGVTYLGVNMGSADTAQLRETMDALKNTLGSAVIVLAAEAEGKLTVVAGVTKDLTSQFNAGTLANAAVAPFGGKGGGKPDYAQAGAGGVDSMAIEKALAAVSLR
ncbi:MAG: alanine--tRNA ligase [Alphaproteobacteria bacterium]